MASLTDLKIRSLQAPAKGQKMHLDGAVRGFGVRVSQGGTKSFVLIVGTERRRHTIGTFPIISLAQARQQARNKLAEIQLGADHAPVRYDTLKARFLTEAKRTTRPRTHASYEWLLGRINLRGDAKAITTRTITEAVKDLTPSVRQHTIAVLKIMFRFAVNEGLLKASPVESFKVKKSKARKRVLTDDEIRKVWNACPSNGFGTTVKLLVLTGQRRTEISHLALADDLVTIDGTYTKNHRTHVFPVTGVTLDLIALDHTWGGWSKSKKELDTACGVTGWTLHDLRRTFRTKWGRLRLPREVAEKYINHVSGVQTPVEQVYDQHDYIDEMRECIKTYTDHIKQLLEPPT
jgi:integrase